MAKGKTFSTFTDLANFLRIKSKPKNLRKVRKCAACGLPLHQIDGTNVWKCENTYLKQDKLGDKDVQVFGVCHNIVLGEPV